MFKRLVKRFIKPEFVCIGSAIFSRKDINWIGLDESEYRITVCTGADDYCTHIQCASEAEAISNYKRAIQDLC